jgi:hypothetical protein
VGEGNNLGDLEGQILRQISLADAHLGANWVEKGWLSRHSALLLQSARRLHDRKKKRVHRFASRHSRDHFHSELFYWLQISNAQRDTDMERTSTGWKHPNSRL